MKRSKYSLRILSACLSALLLLCGCAKKDLPTDASTAPSVSEVQTDTTAEPSAVTGPGTTEPESTAPEATEPADTQTTDAAESATEESTTEGISKPSSKAEIVALYTESANRVKPDAKSIFQNYALKTQTSDANIGGGMLSGIANSLINSNMGYDPTGEKKTYTTYEEKKQFFTVENQTWASKLTAEDVSKATCTEKDGVYTITLWIAPDTTPNIEIGEGHAGKCLSIVTKADIVNGAGSVGMSVIDEDSIRVTYNNGKIIAKIDKATGHMIAANFFMDWTQTLTALGMEVTVSFGIEKDFEIRW